MGKHLTTRWASLGLLTIVVAFASVALAPASQADPGPRFTISVDRHAVHGGETLTVTATATTDCTWLLEWGSERRAEKGRTAEASFVAPAVGRPTRITLHGTCFYEGARPADRSARGNLTAYVPPSWRHDVEVTVLPPGAVVSPPHAAGGLGHHPGGLPGTGGPGLVALLAGLALVVAGSTLVRRRSAAVA